MRTLVFDTETSGMVVRGGSLDEQPNLVQVAGVLFDEQRPVGHVSYIVRQTEEIPEGATRVHGINNDLADRVGVPLSIALPAFHHLMKRADRLVAHNADFDELVMRAAYYREGQDGPDSALKDFDSVPKFCIMKSAESICKLPGRYGRKYKWPNLQEAHKHFLGEGFDDAHDAMVDVLACARVLFKLEDNGHALVRI